MSGLFVTGTDTGVGKTHVTAALAAALAAAGRPVRALKPLATGSEPPGEDAVLLGAAAGHPPLVYTCLPEPAAPARSAVQAGAVIDPEGVLAWVRSFEGDVLVEGVGGWEVPLARGWRVSDLAVALGLPVLVVAANRLGVLNHTLLTVAAVRQAGLPLVGVVLNHGVGDAAAEPLASWNAEDLAAEGLPVVRVGKLGAERAALAAAGEALLGGLPTLAAALQG